MKKTKNTKPRISNPTYDGNVMTYEMNSKSFRVSRENYADSAVSAFNSFKLDNLTAADVISKRLEAKAEEQNKNRKFADNSRPVLFVYDTLSDKETQAAKTVLSSDAWNSTFGMYEDTLRNQPSDGLDDYTLDAMTKYMMSAGYTSDARPLAQLREDIDYVIDKSIPAIFYTDHSRGGIREIWKLAFPPVAWCAKPYGKK